MHVYVYVQVEATIVNDFEFMKDKIGSIAFSVGTLALVDYTEKQRVLL